MKFIIAVIQPHSLDNVREALSKLDVHGMTITEVRGYGRQKGHTEIYRGAEYAVHYTPKMKIEIAVSDDNEQRVVDAIREAAHSGKVGDGKIFVLDLQQAMRIRTGEAGGEAL